MTDPARAIEVLRDKGAYTQSKDASVPVIKLTASAGEGLAALIEHLMGEVSRYREWVNDLQSGMYVNCVYCGHRYGPSEETPVSMADVLKEHIEHCPEHPMSKLKAENERIRQTHVAHEAYQSLLDELEHVKRERDAAVSNVKAVVTHYPCYVCAHSQSRNGYGCDLAINLKDSKWNCAENDRFKWRGLCAENGGGDDGED